MYNKCSVLDDDNIPHHAMLGQTIVSSKKRLEMDVENPLYR
jgi:hypothetical protein